MGLKRSLSLGENSSMVCNGVSSREGGSDTRRALRNRGMKSDGMVEESIVKPPQGLPGALRQKEGGVHPGAALGRDGIDKP